MTALSDIEVLALDIDGVMTDGGLLAMPDGNLLRVYNAKDTFALRMANMLGLRVVVITGARGEAVTRRFTSLGVRPEDLFLNSKDKLKILRRFCLENGFSIDRVAFVGDDLPDLPAIRESGLGVAPADAVEEVRDAADWVTVQSGGKGCVRAVVQAILESKGQWNFDAGQYECTYASTDPSF